MKRKAGLFFAGFAAFACVFLAGCRMAPQQPLLEFDRGAFERVPGLPAYRGRVRVVDKKSVTCLRETV